MMIAALIVLPFWRIFEKAGCPGITALLIFVPVANLILLF
jgi:hypothetical protein